MGPKTETRRVGEVELTCTQFNAMRSLPLFARIGKIVSGAFTHIPANFSMEDDASIFLPMIGELFTRLDETDVNKLVVDILAGTRAEYDTDKGRIVTDLNSQTKLDTVFGGDLSGLLSAAQFALEVNYRDFFDDALAAISAKTAGQIEEKASKSTSASSSRVPGQSGDSG